MQHLQDLLVLKDTEESIEEYLESYRSGLSAVEQQTGDVEHNVGLDDFNLYSELVHAPVAQLVHGCKEGMELDK